MLVREMRAAGRTDAPCVDRNSFPALLAIEIPMIALIVAYCDLVVSPSGVLRVTTDSIPNLSTPRMRIPRYDKTLP